MPRFRWWPTSFLGWVVAAPVAILGIFTTIRLLGIDKGPLVMAVALTPLVAAASLLVLVLAVLSRSWVLMATVGLCVVLQATWLAPSFTGDGSTSTGPAVMTVMTSNVLHGEADATDLVAQVQSHKVDLLSVQELTPDFAAELAAAGLANTLPYSYTRPTADFKGIGLWSRYPLSDDRYYRIQWSVPTLVTDVAVPGLPLTFVAAHPMAPAPIHDATWVTEQEFLRFILGQLSGPVIVAGDFNASLDHRTVRALTDDGFVDAARQAGTGWQPTFPVNYNVPPLFTPDHIMARDTGLVATDVVAVPIAKSDHKALVVTYRRAGPPSG